MTNKKFIILNLMPIFITLFFAIVWFADKTTSRMFVDRISLFQMLFNWFISPAFLLVINTMFSFERKKYKFMGNILFMIANLFLINEIHFYSWAISCNLLNNVDSESELLFTIGWQLPLAITIVIGFIIQIELLIREKKQRNIFQ